MFIFNDNNNVQEKSYRHLNFLKKIPVLDLSAGIEMATIDAAQNITNPKIVLFFLPNLVETGNLFSLIS